jgi:DNA-binding transcriptional MerR regulator
VGLRPVDLARRAGISTQLVRNYESAGTLPPAPLLGVRVEMTDPGD